MNLEMKISLERRWTILMGCIIAGLAGKIILSSLCLNLGGIRQWLIPGQSHAAIESQRRDSPESFPKLMSMLKAERQSLAAREAALKEKENQMGVLRQEIENRLTELTSIQERVNHLLDEEQKIQDEKQRHLITTIEAMPPERSGKLIEKMDEEMVVHLLRRMNGKDAGKILGLLEAEKAARISKKLFN